MTTKKKIKENVKLPKMYVVHDPTNCGAEYHTNDLEDARIFIKCEFDDFTRDFPDEVADINKEPIVIYKLIEYGQIEYAKPKFKFEKV